jgi:hypothetical protein
MVSLSNHNGYKVHRGDFETRPPHAVSSLKPALSEFERGEGELKTGDILSCPISATPGKF